LPPQVIGRARQVLHEHENAEHQATAHLSPSAGAGDDCAFVQLTMFTPLSQQIVDRLKETDLDRLTPIDALNLLNELRRQLR